MEKKEIKTVFTEASFTGLCKNGHLVHRSRISGRVQVTFTNEDMRVLIKGKVLEKEYDDAILMFLLQPMSAETIREVLKRSPLYFDLSQEV